MEMSKDRPRINDYVLYKEGTEWHEGRISSIEFEDGGERYTILAFNTFTEISVKNTEIFPNSTCEMRRKMKNHIIGDFHSKIHFPALLKHILTIDKEMCKDLPYDMPFRANVSQIIQHFIDFFRMNNGCSDLYELQEAYKAFVHCFDIFLPIFLLYESEIEQFKKIDTNPSEVYGFVHLLRLLYFLQKEGADFAQDYPSKLVIFDYTIYLLDFLIARYKEYYY